MGRDAQVPGAGIGGQKARDGGRGAPGAGALVEAVGDGPRADGLGGERLGERGVQLAGVVLVEEPEEERRLGGQTLPTAGEGVEEGVGVRASLAQAIPAPQLVRVMLGGGKRGEVRLGLDALAAVVRADVAGDFGRAVQDTDLVFGGDEGQGPPDQGVRDRVVVAVEAQVRGLAGAAGWTKSHAN